MTVISPFACSNPMVNSLISYPIINRNSGYYLNNGIPIEGETFTGDGSYLVKSGFALIKHNLPVGNVYSRLYAHTHTYGSDGHPTGSALAVSNPVDAATGITGSYTVISFTFDGTYKLVKGTHYCITCEYVTTDPDNNIYIGIDTSPTWEGNMFIWRNDVSYWIVTADWDLIFYVYTRGPKV